MSSRCRIIVLIAKRWYNIWIYGVEIYTNHISRCTSSWMMIDLLFNNKNKNCCFHFAHTYWCLTAYLFKLGCLLSGDASLRIKEWNMWLGIKEKFTNSSHFFTIMTKNNFVSIPDPITPTCPSLGNKIIRTISFILANPPNKHSWMVLVSRIKSSISAFNPQFCVFSSLTK